MGKHEVDQGTVAVDFSMINSSLASYDAGIRKKAIKAIYRVIGRVRRSVMYVSPDSCFNVIEREGLFDIHYAVLEDCIVICEIEYSAAPPAGKLEEFLIKRGSTVIHIPAHGRDDGPSASLLSHGFGRGPAAAGPHVRQAKIRFTVPDGRIGASPVAVDLAKPHAVCECAFVEGYGGSPVTTGARHDGMAAGAGGGLAKGDAVAGGRLTDCSIGAATTDVVAVIDPLRTTNHLSRLLPARRVGTVAGTLGSGLTGGTLPIRVHDAADAPPRRRHGAGETQAADNLNVDSGRTVLGIDHLRKMNIAACHKATAPCDGPVA